jgi:hypothetical protein
MSLVSTRSYALLHPLRIHLAAAALITLAAGCGDDPASAAPDATRPTADVVVDATRDASLPDVSVTLDVSTPLDVSVSPDVRVPPPDAAGGPVVIDGSRVPAGAALYTADRTRFTVRELARALDRVFAGPRVDNVILYVHGRGCGGEPEKSLSEAMPALTRDYTAAPILLYWPGSDEACPLGFPEARAREAGPALAVVLGDLYRYQLENPARVAGVQFTLLTHSMGSLVLEAATAVSGVNRLPASLLATTVINAGASAAPDHAAWVARVTFSRLVFTTVNGNDRVLLAAGLGRSTRLGRSITGARLAAGVHYVDFTANDVNHAYYVASGQSGAGMMAFYQRVMNGLPFDFAASSGVSANDVRDGATVHRFNGR